MRELSLVLATMAAATVFAQEPKKDEPAKKPQWQLVLTGEDAKKADQLEQRIARQEALGNRVRAAEAVAELLKLKAEKLGADHWQVVDDRVWLADLRAERTAEQVKQLQQATQDANEAVALNQRRKYAEAIPLLEKALAVRRKVMGEDHPATAQSYCDLAHNLEDSGRAAEAAPLFEKALATFRRVLGENHPDTAVSYGNLASNLQARG